MASGKFGLITWLTSWPPKSLQINCFSMVDLLQIKERYEMESKMNREFCNFSSFLFLFPYVFLLLLFLGDFQ